MKKFKKKIKVRGNKRKVVIDEIKLEQILLYNRQVFLTGEIDEEKAHEIVTTLTALNAYEEAPISLWINSRGGSVYDGFAIIDCIRGMSSPVVTIINGHACSMGGIIAIHGAKRFMTENSIFMAHDVFTGSADYVTKVKDRLENSEKLQSKIFQMFRDNTKLTEKDLEKARHGELWLTADECLEKGIIDGVMRNAER